MRTVLKIICSFAFLNYDDSRNFLNKVADLAEEEDHHPEITLEWGKVTVSGGHIKLKVFIKMTLFVHLKQIHYLRIQ